VTFGENDREATDYVMAAAWPPGGVVGTCWPIVVVCGFDAQGLEVRVESQKVSALTEADAIDRVAAEHGVVEVASGWCLNAR
jgi:hypothetical protein